MSTEERRAARDWYWGSAGGAPPRVAQIGGDHYEGDIQHWDLCEKYDVGYLEACASKYISRWRRKGGSQDLQKSLSYLEKMGGRPVRRSVPSEALAAWYIAADVEPADAHLCGLILCEGYGSPAHIDFVKAELHAMIIARADAQGF